MKRLLHFMVSVSDFVIVVSMVIIIGVVLIVCATVKLAQLRQRNIRFTLNPNAIDGVLLGKIAFLYAYSPSAAEGHVAVFGGSGCGKTSAVLIPTLQRFSGHALTIDISGDISSNVDRADKLIFAPHNAQSKTVYNIFASVDAACDDAAVRAELLERLALLIMPDKAGASDATDFFNSEGRKILTASLLAFSSHEDFCDICARIVSSSYQTLFTAIDATGNANAISYINSFEGASQKNTAGCKQACDSSIGLFARNEAIRRSVRRPRTGEIAITPATIERNSIFIVIPDELLKLYAPLVSLIISQTFDYLAARPVANRTPILFALDEFASFRLDIMDALRKFRKRRVRVMIATQALADLDLMYGYDTRKAMLNNFAFQLVLQASDADTQRYFSDLIGFKKRPASILPSSTRKQVTEQRELAVEPSEFGRLAKKMVVIYGGGFLRLYKAYYWKMRK